MTFPKITINKSEYKLELSSIWPDRIVPQSQYFEDGRYIAWGYQMDYDGVSFAEKVGFMTTGKFKELALIDGDLLMILWDRQLMVVKAYVGLSGMFPLYFGRTGDKLFLSPDFYEVFREIKDPKLNKDEALDYILQEYFIYQTDQTFIEGIGRLPAGCLLEINGSLDWKISETVFFRELIANPERDLSVVGAVKEIEVTLKKQIQKRVLALKGLPLICEMSSGFDCMIVAYLMKQIGVDFSGYSSYTSKNNDDSDPNVVKKWAEENRVGCEFNDVTDTLFFQDEEDLLWNSTHFFPAWHSLSLVMADEKKKRELFGENTVSFTGNGGDEFLHASDMEEYLNNINSQEGDFIEGFAKDGGENIYTQQAYDWLVNKERIGKMRFYGNRYGGSAAGQCYFSIMWVNGTWDTNPYDTIEMLKLSQRLPKDENGKTISKQKLYFGNTKAFIDDQYRVKLPMHEQVYRFLDERREIMEKILENSVLGKVGLVQSIKLLKALKEGRIKEVTKEHYLTFGNLCRLELFLQANKVES